MSSSQFVYVTYIRVTPAKLWEALTAPEFTKRYWFGMWQDTDWKPGSPWKLKHQDGRVMDAGEVLEAEPEKRLVLKWRNEWKPEMKAEGFTRCTMELEPQGETTKLTIVHESDVANSQTIVAVSSGWPKVLSSLKTLLETGESLEKAMEAKR